MHDLAQEARYRQRLVVAFHDGYALAEAVDFALEAVLFSGA